MKTKKHILEVSRLLFNEKGVMNVTLRDVAKSMNKSYGNITYHFPTKEDVITSLFEEMNNELGALQTSNDLSNLMRYFLELPAFSFDINLKYLFLTIDYNELKRNFSKLFEKINSLNEAGKVKWKGLLMYLRDENYLNQKISNDDLDYLMFLSVSIHFAYFQMTDSHACQKTEFTKIVNKMLQPYLSEKGLVEYDTWLRSQ
jgi:AcrR family transcriptional regulator